MPAQMPASSYPLATGWVCKDAASVHVLRQGDVADLPHGCCNTSPAMTRTDFRGVTPLKAGTSAQDYRVHIKHTDGSFEYIPYFCLPANELNDVIAPSCYSCFDYPNALADLVSNVAVPYSFDWYCACATALCVLKAALP